MKSITTVILLAYSLSVLAQEAEFHTPDFSKPILSLRCKELLKERNEKVKVQQKYNALLQRNRDLIKKSPKARESYQNRLLSNQVKIKNELHLTNLSIQTMEENIVRSGCPGISL